MGAHWSYSIAGATFNLLTLLALFGLATADLVPRAWFAVAGFFGVVLLVGLGEGAYEVWEETDAELEDAKSQLDRRAGRQRTLAWLEERFELGADILRRFRVAGLGEAHQLAEEFQRLDEETAGQMRERLPDLVAEYQAPVLAPEERQTRSSLRDAEGDHLELRLARLLSIREQVRKSDQ